MDLFDTHNSLEQEADVTPVIEVPAGKMIVEEGSLDFRAYLIQKGAVMIYKKPHAGEDLILAILKEGQIFGEMGLVTERPRAASVKAVQDTRLFVVEREHFHVLMRSQPDLLFPVMRVIFERLRNTSTPLLEIAGLVGSDEKFLARKKRATLVPRTPQMELGMRSKSLEIKRFPCKIGRETNETNQDALTYNDLLIPDEEPYSVSRNHCSINFLQGQYFILDRGSTWGTIVNGRSIGGYGVNTAVLDQHRNLLVLGREDSPFRFEIILE